MGNVVVYNYPYGPSARRLADGLGWDAVKSQNFDGDADKVIAWAASPGVGLNGNIDYSKTRQLRTWIDAGLNAPRISRTWREGWLARSSSHHGGDDFTGRLAHPSYWTEPIRDIVSEHRLHVVRTGARRGDPASYRVVRLSTKVNREPHLNVRVNGVEIRSRRFGWRMDSQSNAVTQKPSNQRSVKYLAARWAVATIGWDFGAVDLVIDNEGTPWLIEANSAPSLKDDATLEAYLKLAEVA